MTIKNLSLLLIIILFSCNSKKKIITSDSEEKMEDVKKENTIITKDEICPAETHNKNQENL